MISHAKKRKIIDVQETITGGKRDGFAHKRYAYRFYFCGDTHIDKYRMAEKLKHRRAERTRIDTTPNSQTTRTRGIKMLERKGSLFLVVYCFSTTHKYL